MPLVDVNLANLETEHICCAITDKKGEPCVAAKKAWLRERFADGLVFKKLDARGKVFIEYLPAEKAWCPIDAPGYLYIDCFWVSGQFKGQGYGNELLAACVGDAKAQGKAGLVALSSKKKLPFLSDPGYLKHKGFRVADTSAPSYELLYLPLTENAPVPSFRPCAKEGRIDADGMTLYYTHQCPHTAKYVPLLLQIAEARGETVNLIQIKTTEQAQSAPAPFTTYSFFDHGKLVTNEIFSEKKFAAYLDGRR